MSAVELESQPRQSARHFLTSNVLLERPCVVENLSRTNNLTYAGIDITFKFYLQIYSQCL